MQIVRSGRNLGEPLVEVGHEDRQERVGRLDVRYAGEAQFLHAAILQRPIDPFDPAFGLTRIGAQDLDVEFRQGTAELGHAATCLGILLGDTKHRMLVGIECDGTAVCLQIELERLEVALTRSTNEVMSGLRTLAKLDQIAFPMTDLLAVSNDVWTVQNTQFGAKSATMPMARMPRPASGAALRQMAP